MHSLTVSWLIIYRRSGPDTGYSFLVAQGFHHLDDIMTFLKQIVRSHHKVDIPKEIIAYLCLGSLFIGEVVQIWVIAFSSTRSSSFR